MSQSVKEVLRAMANFALPEFENSGWKVLKVSHETRRDLSYLLLADAVGCRDAVARRIDCHAQLEAEP